MSVMLSKEFKNAKWIIETAAYDQAVHDVVKTHWQQLKPQVDDPHTWIEANTMLQMWARGDNIGVIFAQLPEKDYKSLTPREVERLIDHWINLYPTI